MRWSSLRSASTSDRSSRRTALGCITAPAGKLRPVVPQHLMLHRALGRCDLLAPLPALNHFLSEQGDEHAGDDDRELARIVAPFMPTFRRCLRGLLRDFVVVLGLSLTEALEGFSS